MAFTNADTVEMEEIAKELVKLSNNYIDEINKLFERLSEVPEITKEWQGDQSKKYHNIIARDKNPLVDVGNHLKYIGEKISKDAREIAADIKKNENDGGKRGY